MFKGSEAGKSLERESEEKGQCGWSLVRWKTVQNDFGKTGRGLILEGLVGHNSGLSAYNSE